VFAIPSRGDNSNKNKDGGDAVWTSV